MSKQLLIVFLVAVVAAQVYGFTVIKPRVSHTSVRTMKDIVLKHLHTLESIVNASVNSASHDLDNLRQQTLNYEENVDVNGARAISDEGEKLYNHFKSIADFAEEDGIDITKCFQQYESSLKKLPASIVSELKSCLSSVIGELETPIGRARTNINAISAEVHKIALSLDACGENDSYCLDDVDTTIANAQENLPKQIDVQVNVVLAFVNSLQVSLDDCAANELQDCTNKGNSIINDFQACVYKL